MSAPAAQRALAAARWLALGWLATLWVQAWPLGRLRGSPLFLCDVLLAATWAAAAVAFALERPRRTPVGRVALAGGAYLASQGLSLVAGTSSLGAVAKLVAYAPMVLSPALLLWLFPDREGVLRVIRALGLALAAAVTVGLLTIAVFYVDRATAERTLMCNYGALEAGPYPRLCAPFLNPNMLTSFLIATVPSVAVAAFAWRGARRGVAVAAIASVVALFTLSAGVGAYALALAFALTPWLRRLAGARVLVPLVWAAAIGAEIVLVVASLGTLVPAGTGTISLGARDYLFWDGSRASILTAGIQTFRDHPLFGVGYGSPVAFVTDPRSFVPSHKIPLLTGPVSAWLQAHNLYLSIAGQSGLVGLLGFGALVAALVSAAREAPAADARLAWLRRAAWASFVCAPFVHGFFVAIEEARHFWPMMALLPLVARAGRAEAAPEP